MEVEDAQFLPKDASVAEPLPTPQSALLPPGPPRASASQLPPATLPEPTRATATPFQSSSTAAAAQTRTNSVGPGFDGPSSNSLPQEPASRQKPVAGNNPVSTAAAGEGSSVDQSRGVSGTRGTNGTATHQPMAASVGFGWEETTFPSLAPSGDKSKMNLSKFKFKL